MKVLMKTPSNCPFCGGILRNDFKEVQSVTYLTKVCDKKIDHSIEIRACVRNNDYVDWICIPLSLEANVLWYLGSGSLIVNRFDGKDCRLPFFEPNLTDFRKLINKIKTYLVFS